MSRLTSVQVQIITNEIEKLKVQRIEQSKNPLAMIRELEIEVRVLTEVADRILALTEDSNEQILDLAS